MDSSATHASDISGDILRAFKLLAGLRNQVAPSIETWSWSLLLQIAKVGPKRISELADLTMTDVSVVSRQVSSLEARGIVAKTPDPLDKRAQLVDLTPDGRDLLAQLQALRHRLFSELLAEWHADDIEIFSTHLRRLCEDLESYQPGRSVAVRTNTPA